MSAILVGVSQQGKSEELELKMANRHGLISGATGTGKTVTLQTIAEQFSKNGIPVFSADVKGDLAGIAKPNSNSKIQQRAEKLKLKDYTPQGCPVVFWDLYGKEGIPLRTTISELGPILLGRVFNANDVQQGVINAAFNIADDTGLLLLDIKDFRELLNWMSENAQTLKGQYGNISSSSIGAIQRGLLALIDAGGEQFFSEPALQLHHLMQQDAKGQGIINILDATQLINDPRLYSTFLIWLLSELFEKLPEVGDLDKPKLVFFFDEAHLLFNSAPKSLLDKIEQMVRLIRSKGIGVYFVTQSPMDVPENVLGQLGNRVQHAMRAFTPKDQKAVKAAAQTFRANPNINTEDLILQLKVGEALVSFLDDSGSPTPVEQVSIIPPESQIGAITSEERTAIITKSPLNALYRATIDRESAYELIRQKTQMEPPKTISKPPKEAPRTPTRTRQTSTEVLIKSTARSIGNQVGRQLIRGLLGSLLGGKGR